MAVKNVGKDTGTQDKENRNTPDIVLVVWDLTGDTEKSKTNERNFIKGEYEFNTVNDFLVEFKV